MHAENHIYHLLNVPSLNALVNGNLGLNTLPKGAVYPAVQFDIISTVPIVDMCEMKTYQARVQVSAFAKSPSVVNQLHDAVRSLLNIQRTTTPSGVVHYCRFLSFGIAGKDEGTGLSMKTADYQLVFS